MPAVDGYPGPSALQLCTCALYKIILANVDRGWPGLSDAPKVPSSPLSNLVGKNVWITAENEWFRAHMRHVAVRMPPAWGFRVASDAELIQAWLATVALKGEVEIYDADVRESRSMKHLTLMDIALPPSLLVVRLGVKTARNVAMSEVLEEAIGMRLHERRPTWVWDQTGRPFDELHICYSPTMMETMLGWDRVLESDWDAKESRRITTTQVQQGMTTRELMFGKQERIDAPTVRTVAPPVERTAPPLPPIEEVMPEGEECEEESEPDSLLGEMMGRAPRVKKNKSAGFSGKKKGFGR